MSSSTESEDNPAHQPTTAKVAAGAIGNGNGAAPALAPYGDRMLRINPSKEHRPEKYDDLRSEFDAAIFSSLEKHLPPSMLRKERDSKIEFMKEILGRYLPQGERARVSQRLV